MTTPVPSWLPGMDITAGRLESMNQRAWVMVTNYGADSSGTVDAAPAIQLALNDARDRGGAWVLIPPGVYLTASTIRIYGNTRLTLMAGAELRRNHGGTMLLNGDSGQNFPGYTGHSNIIVEGGLWNMRGTTAGMTSSAMCMSFGHCQDIVIRDLEIRDVPGFHAVELNSTNHALISNCRFRGYKDPGGRDFSEAVQLDLAKSSGVFGGFGPYDNTETKDVTISACHFGDSGTAGTTAWPRGIGSHSATITKWHRRIRISDCSFENLTQFAISAYNWEDVTISSNTFVSCGSGVRLRTVIVGDLEDTKLPDGTQTNASQVMRNITVTGNSFRGGGGYDNAIVAQGETSGTVLNLTVVGNTIDGTSGGQAGIRMRYVSRATLGNNVIANVAGTGISTENMNNMTLTGNTVWWPGGRGITCVDSDNSSIVGNQVRDAWNEGILLQTSSYIHVRDNFVKGASRATNGGFSGIRASDGQNALTFTGNTVRPNSDNANKMSYGLSIGAVTNTSRWGNDLRQIGGTNVNGGLVDGTTSGGSAVATDIQ
ncbi:right-handed parallel beta-helix repeat-containing protein [Streptomyces sp. 135]|uniref:right-handed parallel beta-helix repeat-containing protein n=1 Tax=Streptomyces sp. 135 TaxID=2838850 RepID=UPI001CBF893A|nr:right-handed parallel beta-helix repeat-containing protein [Streptomyces sp. 135]